MLISLEGMEFYAHHGHYHEERVIGTRFVLDLHFEAEVSDSRESDELKDTVNYLSVYSLVREEMGQDSKLLEHVASRILKRVLGAFPRILRAEVKVCKMNPSLGGQVEKVCVTLNSDELS
ncbi:MAG TPA: dihydroneopterin aldolase [Bacteroidales bacterium]|nr:dihydroneopterin aldolase [Bacteroidales bacterium]HRZ77878.1 dihydroneopterin aldolase [Bacteroidales bacterium]